MVMPARMMLFLTLIAAPRAAQESKLVRQDDLGYLSIRHGHLTWPSPEVLVKDLRSKDDPVRLKALVLLGLTEQQAHVSIWAQTPPSKVIGEAVVTPDQIRLTYAALGEDATQQAILAVQISQRQQTFASIAVPKGDSWDRVAVFDCWCKYEMVSGQDALAESVQIRPAPEPGPTTPQHFELVLRASGGRTGIYTENEGHFRIYRQELRPVMSFVSRRRSCDPTGPPPHWCDIEKRWFYPAAFGNTMGGVLVESRGRFESDHRPQAWWSVRDLENRDLQQVTCVTYKWNAQSFQYDRVTGTNPCKFVKQ